MEWEVIHSNLCLYRCLLVPYWIKADLLSLRPRATNFSETSKIMFFKMSSANDMLFRLLCVKLKPFIRYLWYDYCFNNVSLGLVYMWSWHFILIKLLFHVMIYECGIYDQITLYTCIFLHWNLPVIIETNVGRVMACTLFSWDLFCCWYVAIFFFFFG